MTWLAVTLLALAAFALTAWWRKAPRDAWSAIGAALLLGLVGYATQASPGLGGAPKAAAQQIEQDPAAMIASRNALDESGIPPNNRWIVIADGMTRNGQYANAAQVLLGAIDDDPGNAQAWLALGNALVGHADGQITPASLHAYNQAMAAAPQSPGPPYFLGLAYAQSGRFAEARGAWTDLLERSPADAPWRPLLSDRLGRLDLLIEAQARDQAGGQMAGQAGQ
jgi:cytochrome c-type biogenesis protein CcmH